MPEYEREEPTETREGEPPEEGLESVPVEGEAPSEPSPGALLQFLVVALALFLWPLAALHRIVHQPFWGHLTAAEVLLGRWPDAARFAAAGPEPWSSGWVWRVPALWVWEFFGGPGLTLAHALLVLAAGTFLYRAARAAGAEPALASVLLWPALLTARMRFVMGPETAGLVLFAFFTWRLVERDRRGEAVSLWILMPAMVLWANLHLNFLMGLLLLVLYLVGSGLARFWKRNREEEAGEPMVRTWDHQPLLVTAGCFLAPLLTPHPFEPYRRALDGLQHLDQLGVLDSGWASMGVGYESLPFWVLLLGTATLLVLDARRGGAALCWFLGFGWLALQFRALGGMFAVVAAPAAGASLRRIQPVPLGEVPGQDPMRAARARRLVLGGLCMVELLLVPVALRSPVGPPGLGVDWSRVPNGAARFVDQAELLGGIYNDPDLGPYLAYRFQGRRKIFLDGVAETTLERMKRRDAAAVRGPEAFAAYLAQEGIEVLMLEVEAPEPVSASRSAGTLSRASGEVLGPDSDWALVYWDDVALVKVRRGGPNGIVARGREYRHVDPRHLSDQLVEVFEGRMDAKPILEELDRRKREDPPSRFAQVWRDRIAAAAEQATRNRQDVP